MGLHSQKDEDLAIMKLVGDKTGGRFLDIGAYDGIHYSNTYALVERGWLGVMVEPGLEAFQGLLANLGGNERVRLIHAAVGTLSQWCLTRFWNNPRTFSTTQIETQGRFLCEGFSAPYMMPMIPLDVLFHTREPFDVVSIDTEGTSVDLFRHMLDDLHCEPYVICVEHDGRLKEVKKCAAEHGYMIAYENQENYVMVRS